MSRLELRFPPVLIFIVCVGLMYGVHELIPVLSVALPAPYAVFAICFVASGVFGVGGVYAFRKAKTTVNPVQVHKASCVVASGVYRFSRNPMYLALLLLLFGWAYLLQNLASLALCALFIGYMNRFQIVPEERYLATRFSSGYLAYKANVRRWI